MDIPLSMVVAVVVVGALLGAVLVAAGVEDLPAEQRTPARAWSRSDLLGHLVRGWRALDAVGREAARRRIEHGPW